MDKIPSCAVPGKTPGYFLSYRSHTRSSYCPTPLTCISKHPSQDTNLFAFAVSGCLYKCVCVCGTFMTTKNPVQIVFFSPSCGGKSFLAICFHICAGLCTMERCKRYCHFFLCACLSGFCSISGNGLDLDRMEGCRVQREAVWPETSSSAQGCPSRPRS